MFHLFPSVVAICLTLVVPSVMIGCGTTGESMRSDRETSIDPTLGVIRLDYHYPPILGDVDFPGSFAYPVVYEMVEGLTFKRCQQGELDEALRKGIRDAVRRLEGRGVAGISGDCGFMINYQQFIQKQTELPVFMSSVLLAPAILPLIDPSEKVAIMTANSKSLEPALPGMLEQCGLQGGIDRFLVVGCQDVPGFDAVANAKKVDRAMVGPGIERLAMKIVKDHPDVKAFIFECTELGAYANRVRSATGLPVFDSITVMDFYQGSMARNPRLDQ